MRKTFQLIVALLLLFLLLPPALQAQERTITGTILSEDSKAPLSGVTIRVKGSRQIVQTDANGKFSIKVNSGETLLITYVGYQTEEIKAGDAATIGISLKAADNTMGEVIVTAMDIKRSPRSLGYSTQTVSGDVIQETQRENFLNSLQGRVAGLTLDQTSGLAGSSSSVVLRGFNSLSLSNQPLYVVDGVILDNSTLNETSGGGIGLGLASDRSNRESDYQNRIADINPSDIASLTVLKGPEATALYGSQASSGAIIITTRKAKTNEFAIQYDNSVRLQKITRFPETLDTYSNGTNGIAANLFGSGYFRRFGPAYPEGTKLFDNKKNFFRTGTAQTHNLGMDFGFKESKFRVSGSYFDQKGIVPNNNFKRYSARISNTTKFLKDKIEIVPSFAYTKSENDKVLRGGGGYLLSLLIWPSTNDIRKFENDLTGDKGDLFEAASTNGEYDNPLWNVNNNIGGEEVERLNYTLGINLRPYKWLTVNGRFGYDTYTQTGFLFYHPQSFYVSAGSGGSLDNYWRKYAGYNHTINATATKKAGKNIDLRLMAGTMWQDYKTEMFAVKGINIVDSVGGLTNISGNGKMYLTPRDAAGNVIPGGVPAIIDNRALKAMLGDYMDSTLTRPGANRLRLNRNKFGEPNYVLLRQLAFFGEFAISYKNFLFLNYTHRFEQASTLPEKNRRYDYPGASVSLIVSDMFPALKKGNILNFWKLRGSRASTARLNSPYSTQSVFVDNLGSGGGYSYGFVNNNFELEPEKQKTFELGTEVRLFKSRFAIDLTYYNTLNTGQIIEGFRLSYGTGYVLNTQNAGSTRNKGVEISLDYSVVKKKDFTWDMRFNFNKMRNKVVGLPKNVTEYYIADTWLYTGRGGLTLGGPTTSITGSGYSRNSNGNILINPSNGLPVIDATFLVRGDRNANFTTGWSNNFRYKKWRVSMLWDLKVGGDIYNGNNEFLTKNGLSKYTEDRYEPRVIKGVLNDGLQNSATPTANTIVVIPALNDQYYATLPVEEFIEKDVNWFRLRDLTISYTFRPNLIKGVKGLSAFVTGNDLILLTNYSGPDPSVNGLTAGARGVGGFGFDYGTLPSPVQLNIGIKVSF